MLTICAVLAIPERIIQFRVTWEDDKVRDALPPR